VYTGGGAFPTAYAEVHGEENGGFIRLFLLQDLFFTGQNGGAGAVFVPALHGTADGEIYAGVLLHGVL